MNRLLSIEEWEEEYSPIQDVEGNKIYETYGEYLEELKADADVISTERGTEPYRHVWTVVDGDSGKLIILNGWHLCNRIHYLLTDTPWGDGSESDKDIYIEVTYE